MHKIKNSTWNNYQKKKKKSMTICVCMCLICIWSRNSKSHGNNKQHGFLMVI